MVLAAWRWKWTFTRFHGTGREKLFFSSASRPLSSLEVGDFVELCYYGQPILGLVKQSHEPVQSGSSVPLNYSVCLESGVERPLYLSDVKYQVRAASGSLPHGSVETLKRVEAKVSHWLSTHGDTVEDWLWQNATGRMQKRMGLDIAPHPPPPPPPPPAPPSVAHGPDVFISHLMPYFRSSPSNDWMVELALWRALYYHSELVVKSPHYSFAQGGPFYFRSRQEREFVRRLRTLLESPMGSAVVNRLKSTLQCGTGAIHLTACSPEEKLLLEALSRQATAHSHSDYLPNSPYYALAKTLVPSEWHTNADLYRLLNDKGLFHDMPPSTIYTRQYCIEEANEPHQASNCRLPSSLGDSRMDFEHLVAYALDSPDTIEVDDALSIEQDVDNASFTLYIHVADPTHYIPFNDPIERRMRSMNSTLYLPESKITLLPPSYVSAISLEQKQASMPHCSHPTLTLVVKLDEQGHTLDYQIRLGRLRHIVRLSYEESEALLTPAPSVDALALAPPQSKAAKELKMMHALMDKRFTARVAAGYVPFDRPSPHLVLNEQCNRVVSIANDQTKSSKSKRLISESMILANHLTATYASERGLAIPFRSQARPTEPLTLALAEAYRQAYLMHAGVTLSTESRHDGSSFFFEQPTTLSQLESLLTSLPKSQLSVRAEPHWAMNLSVYCRVTSPMRRYGDMLTHYTLKSYLQTGRTNGPVAPSALPELLVYSNEIEGRIKMIQKKSIRYWLLHHIASQPHDVEWSGVVLDASSGQGLPFSHLNTQAGLDASPSSNLIKVYIPTLFTTFLVKWTESPRLLSKPDPYQQVKLRPSLILLQAAFIKWNILQVD